MFYESLILTTKQKPIPDTLKIKRKEPKNTTKGRLSNQKGR